MIHFRSLRSFCKIFPNKEEAYKAGVIAERRRLIHAITAIEVNKRDQHMIRAAMALVVKLTNDDEHIPMLFEHPQTPAKITKLDSLVRVPGSYREFILRSIRPKKSEAVISWRSREGWTDDKHVVNMPTSMLSWLRAQGGKKFVMVIRKYTRLMEL